jgi:pyrroline-5-carboxylate reductase
MNQKTSNPNKKTFAHRFAFIGVGNMGGALLNGFLKSGLVKPEEIIVFDIDNSKYNNYIMQGIKIAPDTASAVRGAEYTVIALKPSIVGSSMNELSADKSVFEDTTFVSIAASVPIDFICEKLGMTVPVIRTMPSTPMLIGQGAVALCRNEAVKKEKFEFICRLFSEIAEVSVMEESGMNSIISVNGSSPAYVYLFVKAMLEGAMEQGITKEQAMPLILKTIEGTVDMIRQSDVDIDELIKRVASPNGTTLAALNSFEKDDFVGAVKHAMAACTKRADEISIEIKE